MTSLGGGIDIVGLSLHVDSKRFAGTPFNVLSDLGAEVDGPEPCPVAILAWVLQDFSMYTSILLSSN